MLDSNKVGPDTTETIGPSKDDLLAIYEGKYGNKPDLGWGPKMRLRFDYFTPDDHYEAIVNKLVVEGCTWADVGCGRDIFPSNKGLAESLSRRSSYLLGIDPDENIRDNPLLSEGFQGVIEDYVTNRQYDVVTLRMVAEHIADPKSAMTGIDKLIKHGGCVVIYTPNKWAPMSIWARSTPLSVHHFFKKILWNTEERDTFPVQFKMNTRNALCRLLQSSGFKEEYFSYLDDCRTFQKFSSLNSLELNARRMLNGMKLHYPENCLLGVYRKL